MLIVLSYLTCQITCVMIEVFLYNPHRSFRVLGCQCFWGAVYTANTLDRIDRSHCLQDIHRIYFVCN